MHAIRRKLRAATIALTVVSMLTVSGCAWFRTPAEQLQLAFMGRVLAATYIVVIGSAWAHRAVGPDEATVYRVLYGYRTLALVTSVVVIAAVLKHFNDHRTLWLAIPLIAVFLRSIPDLGRFGDHQNQHRDQFR